MKRTIPRPAKIPKQARRNMRRRAMEIGVPPEVLFEQFRATVRMMEYLFSQPPWRDGIVGVGECTAENAMHVIEDAGILP